jgi:hypothetical protein
MKITGYVVWGRSVEGPIKDDDTDQVCFYDTRKGAKERCAFGNEFVGDDREFCVRPAVLEVKP